MTEEGKCDKTRDGLNLVAAAVTVTAKVTKHGLTLKCDISLTFALRNIVQAICYAEVALHFLYFMIFSLVYFCVLCLQLIFVSWCHFVLVFFWPVKA